MPRCSLKFCLVVTFCGAVTEMVIYSSSLFSCPGSKGVQATGDGAQSCPHADCSWRRGTNMQLGLNLRLSNPSIHSLRPSEPTVPQLRA